MTDGSTSRRNRELLERLSAAERRAGERVDRVRREADERIEQARRRAEQQLESAQAGARERAEAQLARAREKAERKARELGPPDHDDRDAEAVLRDARRNLERAVAAVKDRISGEKDGHASS